MNAVAHTLLLADDSITIQRVIELTFADEDVRVVAVGDGEAAVAALNASPPDIVLADLEMPGRSGYDVARYIKMTPRLAHIPVLLLSGAFEPVDEAQVAAARCEGVLAKPFDPHLLVARVRELLGRGAPQPPAPRVAPAVGGVAAVEDVVAQAPKAAASTDEYLEELDAALTERIRSGWRPPAAVVEPDPHAPEPTPEAPTTPVAPAAVPAPATIPTLADAFTALLSAEQNIASSRGDASRSRTLDDQIHAAVRRVLEETSDRLVRDLAHEILTKVAERIVREEIERIKGETQ